MSDQADSAAKANPEVNEKPLRRRFDAAYKLRILDEAGCCSQNGQLGQLLRREGLDWSHLTNWRRLREQGVLQSLAPKLRGRKAKPHDQSTPELSPAPRSIGHAKQQSRQARIRRKPARHRVRFRKQNGKQCGKLSTASDSGTNHHGKFMPHSWMSKHTSVVSAPCIAFSAKTRLPESGGIS